MKQLTQLSFIILLAALLTCYVVNIKELNELQDKKQFIESHECKATVYGETQTIDIYDITNRLYFSASIDEWVTDKTKIWCKVKNPSEAINGVELNK